MSLGLPIMDLNLATTVRQVAKPINNDNGGHKHETTTLVVS